MAEGEITPLVAGNWKMNGLKARLDEVRKLANRLKSNPAPADLLLCPPYTLLTAMAGTLEGTPIALGAQDCHTQDSGAHTGDVSAAMLKDAGCRFVIVGHSERRADHGEDDATVRAKAQAAHRDGLTAIVCVGETEAERDRGDTLEIVGRQLTASLTDNASPFDTVVAYEPVWAIGTGRTPSADDVAEVHGFIREHLRKRFEDGALMRILYGGSVKPENAAELMSVAHVNGALVGGASLTAEDFDGIVDAYR